MSGSVIAILSIVAIVLIAGVAYHVASGKKNERIGKTAANSK